MSQGGASGERRLRILDAGEQEFAAAGYEGARIEGIARSVGVRKAALYYYFPSKAALYAAVVHRLVGLIEERVGPALDAPGRFEDRLERVLSEMNDLLAERPTLARLVVQHLVGGQGCQAAGDVGPVGTSALARRFLLFYEAGCKAGAFRRMEPGHVVANLFGTTFLYYATGARGAGVMGGDDPAHSRARNRDEATRRFIARGLLAHAQSGGEPPAAPD